jgi:hypothetical protein
MKKKKWWDEEMTYLKQQVNAAYIRYCESNFQSMELENDLKVLRRHFRSRQREKEKLSQKGTQRKLEYLFRKDRQGFWKALNKKKNKTESVNVGIERLKSSFEDLFNKKIVDNSNGEHLERIISEVKSHSTFIGDERLEFSIDNAEFEMVVKSLKNSKSVGFAEISNEMIKYGGSSLSYIIKLILEKIIQYGKIPHFFNVGKIIPLIKDDKKDAHDLNNVRPITISDSLTNVFEKVVLLEIEKTHKEHSSQFGFKKNSSCNHAVFVLKETVNFYKYNKNSVHMCAIDASKAFDKVNRWALMHKLIDKTNNPIWRILFVYYNCSSAYVCNNDVCSLLFKTTIGVKQGGPLSPRLFSIYVEDLITELEDSGLGTHINGISTGVIMYADDLIIMSDTKLKMQRMLLIVENYCKRWEIKINAEKSQHIRFGPGNAGEERGCLKLDGQPIETVEKMKYLGVWISNNLKCDEHIEQKRTSTVNAFNSLRKVGITDINMNPSLKAFMYKVYCRPILYYGIENLSLLKKDLKEIQTAEATLIKRSLGLSKTVHSSKLLTAMEITPAVDRIQSIKLNFLKRICGNEKTAKIINALIHEFNTHGDKRQLKNSLLGEVVEYTNEGVLRECERKAIIKAQIKNLGEKERKSAKCGIVDSIKTCLKRRDDPKKVQMLKLLVQSYERPSRPLRMAQNT